MTWQAEAVGGSLNDRAYLCLKRAIVRCELRPGAEVSESELVTFIGMGKAPIRSALARLRQDGLVAPLAQRGYRVAPVTLADVKEIFDARLVVEPAVARLAAGRLTPDTCSRLRSFVSAGYEPGDRQSEARFLEANRQFHLCIAEVADNSRLYRIVDQLLTESDRTLHVGLSQRDFSGKFQHEHTELMAALEAGDVEAAHRLTDDALRGGYEMIRAALVSDPAIQRLPLTIS